MTETVKPEDFTNRFLDLRQFKFQTTLNDEQVDRIRYHLFPDIRIVPSVMDDEIPDIVAVMDLKQEQLARGLGDGHRVIRGVAGSGKTFDPDASLSPTCRRTSRTNFSDLLQCGSGCEAAPYFARERRWQ